MADFVQASAATAMAAPHVGGHNGHGINHSAPDEMDTECDDLLQQLQVGVGMGVGMQMGVWVCRWKWGGGVGVQVRMGMGVWVCRWGWGCGFGLECLMICCSSCSWGWGCAAVAVGGGGCGFGLECLCDDPLQQLQMWVQVWVWLRVGDLLQQLLVWV